MSTALEISNDLFGFDIYLKERYLENAYERHPWKMRIAMVSVGAVSGFSKVFLFPIISLVGLVAFPIMALYRAVWKRDGTGACNYLKATFFCVLGLAATLTFISVSAYFIPLVWSCALFATALIISISIHVHKMAKKPDFLETRPELA